MFILAASIDANEKSRKRIFLDLLTASWSDLNSKLKRLDHLQASAA